MGRKQDDPRGKQKGAQEHAEGQHGAKAHDHFREEIQAPGPEERADVEQRDREAPPHPRDGGHRLFEGRHQTDPADRASGKNRLARDVDEHGHDREGFRLRGGAGSAPDSRRGAAGRGDAGRGDADGGEVDGGSTESERPGRRR